MKYFSTAGICDSAKHCMTDAPAHSRNAEQQARRNSTTVTVTGVQSPKKLF
jgi:hypothetical protein